MEPYIEAEQVGGRIASQFLFAAPAAERAKELAELRAPVAKVVITDDTVAKKAQDVVQSLADDG